MSPLATLADADEVRRALVTSVAAIRCKCLHAAAYLRRGTCTDCHGWAADPRPTRCPLAVPRGRRPGRTSTRTGRKLPKDAKPLYGKPYRP